MRIHALLVLVPSIVLPAVASAQGCFDPNIGSPLALADEDVSPPQALGFSFTWPDGTVSSTAVATSNGRVAPGMSGLIASFNVSTAQFLGDSTAIAAIYADLDFGEPNAGDVEFYADPGGTFATFTFRDAVDFGGGLPFSFQVQLNSDDTFALRIDDRVTTALGGGLPLAITGFTEGNGTLSDPGSVDLSAVPGGVVDSGSTPTTYELFSFSPFDLASSELLVTPNGTGGFLTVIGTCVGFPVVTDLGGACNTIPAPDPKVGIRWTPDGSGGYTSAVDPTVAFNPLLGPAVGAGLDSLTLVDLGFPFTMPAGTVTTQLQIDSNGRLILPTSTSLSTFAPEVADIEAEEQIAVLWSDWVTALGGAGGSIHFATDGVGSARITWNETQAFTLVPPSQTVGTFQIQLFGGTNPLAGGWAVCLQRSNLDPSNANIAIGASDGMPSAVEVDLFPGPAVSTSGSLWEWFDSSVPEVYDIQPSAPTGANRMDLAVIGFPRIGSTFDANLVNVPATAAFGGLAFGFFNISSPLALIDPTNPCLLFSSTDFVVPIVPGSTSQTTTFDLTAADSMVVGLNFVLQAVIADVTLPFTIPVITSNGLDVTVGF